jgi:hypothetical protein
VTLPFPAVSALEKSGRRLAPQIVILPGYMIQVCDLYVHALVAIVLGKLFWLFLIVLDFQANFSSEWELKDLGRITEVIANPWEQSRNSVPDSENSSEL